jgi:hypothetical protein
MNQASISIITTPAAGKWPYVQILFVSVYPEELPSAMHGFMQAVARQCLIRGADERAYRKIELTSAIYKTQRAGPRHGQLREDQIGATNANGTNFPGINCN